MTFNEQFLDGSIRHQIDLLRFGRGVAKRVNGLLDATRSDLRKQVERRLGKVTGITGASLRRLKELESAIVKLRSPAWNDVTEEWTRTATDIALDEPLFVAGQLTNILPVELDFVQPSERTLRALVTTRPFQGKFLREWAQSTQRADLSRIQQQIRIGMVAGESSQDIARRVFGEHGAMSITRSQAEAVTRTFINHASNAAQQEFLQANSDLFDVEVYVSTLDSRTTPICRSLDGKQFPVGKGPIPPSHVACRSIRCAVVDGQVIGDRPFKAGTEQQMLREYAAANGLGKLGSRDDLPRGHKRAFDEFSRRRMRELTGQVPARTTYQEWLKRQPPEIQDDILGPTRGKLFREGGLTLDRFVNREGDELTLDELRQRNLDAWMRAGLERAVRGESISTGGDLVAGIPVKFALSGAPNEITEAAVRGLDRVGYRQMHARLPGNLQFTDQVVEFQPTGKSADRLRGLRVSLDDNSVPQSGTAYYTDDLRLIRMSSRPDDYRGAGYVLQESVDTTRRGNPFPVSQPNGKHMPLGVPGGTTWIAKTPAEEAQMVAVHEFGHDVHLNKANVTLQKQIDDIVLRHYNAEKREATSAYGDENHNEFFAEAFTAYWHYPPGWMARNAPKSLEMVEEVIRLRGMPLNPAARGGVRE